MRNSKQLQFNIKQHGGRRQGAGRKKLLTGQPNHTRRARVSSSTPLGITLKLRPQLSGLRSIRHLRSFARAVGLAKLKGLRVIHFSILSNHLHLIVETEDNPSLERGMKSLVVSLAAAINQVRLVSGAVFNGRYHLHVLKTPTEVKRAIKYVLFNFSKHARMDLCMDPFSSILAFAALTELMGDEMARKIRRGVSAPRTRDALQALSTATSWLLRVGWRKGR